MIKINKKLKVGFFLHFGFFVEKKDEAMLELKCPI